jgi:hypothetical protein
MSKSVSCVIFLFKNKTLDFSDLFVSDDSFREAFFFALSMRNRLFQGQVCSTQSLHCIKSFESRNTIRCSVQNNNYSPSLSLIFIPMIHTSFFSLSLSSDSINTTCSPSISLVESFILPTMDKMVF